MNKDLAILINEWKYHTEKCKEIIKYLYNHTELFEKKYMQDFREDLFLFIAGKINKYSNDINKLQSYFTNEEIEELNKIKLLGR